MGGLAQKPASEDDRLGAIRATLVRAVERTCPAWLKSQRDDIVQAAMLRVLAIVREDREGFDRLGPSYLWRMAYTATIDEIRRHRARHEVELGDHDPAGGGGPDDRAHGKELAAGISDCVGRLVEARQLAGTLYLQGHGITEAAAVLGWGAKRVENLVYRGLDDLRRCLTAKGITP